MKTINTTAKYIVLGSAFRSNLSNTENFLRNAEMGNTLGLSGYKAQSVVGSYQRVAEMSYAIPANNMRELKELINLFCVRYEQDCVAIWNRDNGGVFLADNEAIISARLGNMRASQTMPDTEDWTFNGSVYFYTEEE